MDALEPCLGLVEVSFVRGIGDPRERAGWERAVHRQLWSPGSGCGVQVAALAQCGSFTGVARRRSPQASKANIPPCTGRA